MSFGDPMENLITDRLIIRPLKESDFQAWSDANSGQKISNRSLTKSEQTVPSTQRNLADFQERIGFYRNLRENDRVYHYGVFDRANPSRLMGALSLTILERMIVQRAVLGYHIYSDFLRQGYGTEAVKAVMLFAFTDLKLHRIEALMETSNRPSAALALAVGMKKEGILRKALFDERSSGKWVDAVLYAGLAEDYGVKGMKPSVRLEIKDH